MTSASVGFHCPECIRGDSRGTREARTIFGGRLTANQGQLTRIIIGITVVVFVAQATLGGQLTDRFAMVGLRYDPFSPGVVGVAGGEYYRLITAAFLHAGFLHIAFNMYTLYIFGPPLESALGRVRFAGLYLLSAAGGAAASFIFNAPGTASVGASGAIFGLFGAFFVVNRRLRRDTSGLIALVIINLALGFVVPNIDWHGHLGGLVTGVTLATVYAYAPPQRRAVFQMVGVAVVALALAATVTFRVAALTS
jgi:membrane associated rhomboid family serine protease